MARLAETNRSHSSARRTNRSVGIRYCRVPVYTIIRWKPIRPMSWVSGIQLSETSDSSRRAARSTASELCRMLPWVSTTPFGSLVDPDENWMNAGSSRPSRAGVPSRDTSSSWSTRKLRCATADQTSPAPASPANAASRSRSLRSVYSQGVPSCRAIRSSFSLCSSLMPGATGTGTMPP